MSHIGGISNNGQLQNVLRTIAKGGQGVKASNSGGAEELNEVKSGQPNNAAEEASEGNNKGVNINTKA